MISSRSMLYIALITGLVGTLLLAACGGAPSAAPTPAVVEQEDSHTEEEEHVEDAEGEDEHMDEAAHEDEDTHGPEEHMAGTGHDVPEEAAALPNPVDADEKSLQEGASIYATSCATCHGEAGEGDGPAAAGLEQKPADLHADHVQENTDGALFYIVSHGRPGTAMPAWEDQLSEEERWHVVNFLRTFG
jgi:mono/diheme cytochrome c family protein